MLLREAIQKINGFRYIVEQLDLSSAPGQRMLYDLPWLDSYGKVEAELYRVKKVYGYMEEPEGTHEVEKVTGKLMQVRDIRGTIGHVGDASVLDDVELFELKNFALLSEDIRKWAGDWQVVDLPGLDPVVGLLDPEKKRIPHFYIYDAYSAELAALRQELKRKQQQGAAEKEIEAIYFKSVEVEDRIREELSAQLHPYYGELRKALEEIALLDIVIAKAALAKKMHLVCPLVRGKGRTGFKALFYPHLEEVLAKEGKHFQPVDVEIQPRATLVTGANMAGKTVLLKSVALAQCLMQFGFWVPAAKAEMQLVEEVLMSIGDEQDELNGLSSFAAEMFRINEIVEQVKSGRRILVLIDELARTTNPVEGRAIVNGVVDFLTGHGVMALVTTHYNGIEAPCRKLRVKGFVEKDIQGRITLKNINDYIDYSLEEDEGNEIPQEALRIAALLGVDDELLEKAKRFLEER